MAAPEGDVTVVESKPSRLAPLKKSPTSKASVETFFRVPGPPASAPGPAPPRRARPATALRERATETPWLCAPPRVRRAAQRRAVLCASDCVRGATRSTRSRTSSRTSRPTLLSTSPRTPAGAWCCPESRCGVHVRRAMPAGEREVRSCLAQSPDSGAERRYLYNKLGGFFGIQPDHADQQAGDKERACIIRMHVECVTKDKTGRAHFVRRATMKDGDKILFRAWQKEATAQLDEVFSTALGEPAVNGQSPADAEIAALKDKIAALEAKLAEAQKGGGAALAPSGNATR